MPWPSPPCTYAVPAGRVGHQVPGDHPAVRDGLVDHQRVRRRSARAAWPRRPPGRPARRRRASAFASAATRAASALRVRRGQPSRRAATAASSDAPLAQPRGDRAQRRRHRAADVVVGGEHLVGHVRPVRHLVDHQHGRARPAWRSAGTTAPGSRAARPGRRRPPARPARRPRAAGGRAGSSSYTADCGSTTGMREQLGQLDQRRERLRVAPGGLDREHRPLRRGEQPAPPRPRPRARPPCRPRRAPGRPRSRRAATARAAPRPGCSRRPARPGPAPPARRPA